MYSKIKQFLDAVPSALKSANEIYNFARNKYKQMMGVFPDGLDDVFLKRGAAEMQDARQKVVEFPPGGKDKTDFFTTRPDPRVKQPPGAKMDVQRANENLAGGANYAEGDTKYNADVLADEIARMRGANREDLPVDDQIKLYSEAYDYLTELNRLNRPSPGKGELSVTIEGQTKNMTPEGIMEFLMKRGTKGTDITGDTFIGKAPKTKKTKPAVDPELQKSEDQKQMFMDFEDRIETEAEMLERMKRQNKESVERLKKKKEKDLGDKLKDLPDDIPDMADGGRIGFGSGSVGAVGFAGNQTEQSQPGGGQMEMPRNTGFQPIFPMPQKNIPGSGGIKELKQFLQAVGAPELGMGYNFPVGQRGILGVGVAPSGNVGAQLKIPLSGGRFGFKDGSKPKNPGRRTFLKGMAGLAAIPFIGKFFKPVAKVAQAGGPAIAEGVKLGFDKFMMLVDKIKRLGRKTDAVTQKEREVGYTYQGKDGSEYELVEDLTTGDLRITKDKPGGMTVGDKSLDVIEDRSTFYLKRNQADETTKGKKPPDEYDEVKEIPSPDGTFDDVDDIDNETVREILEELGETRTKKASGGLAYMLGE